MKKLVLLLLILIGLAYTAIYRASSFYVDNQYYPSTPFKATSIDSSAVANRLSAAVKLQTISKDQEAVDGAPFEQFHQLLEENYPNVHQYAKKEIINQYSLVYHFEGSDKKLKPILLMGHIDVVPVDEATLGKWKQAPFSGAIAEGQIWGRGTLDDKSTILAIMEAMELHLSSGNKLKRAVYFAFGHDEEVGGEQGAKAVAEHFKSKGLEFDFVLDEGGAIVDGVLAGFEQPIALVGIAEKGFVNVRLTVEGEGGHSSMPPKNTAAGILAQAIVKLEENQFPSDLKFTNLIFDSVGFSADFTTRAMMSNQWLLAPLIKNVLSESPSSAASLRTTTAVTMLKGSSKSNILPTQASAIANFRILPGDTWETVLAHVETVVDDPRVKLEAFMQSDPSPVSNHHSKQFAHIGKTIREIAPDTLVSPYLVQGGTDAKYFYELSDQVYRFLMIRMTPDTLKAFHGVNERIAVDDYVNTIQFFHRLLERTSF